MTIVTRAFVVDKIASGWCYGGEKMMDPVELNDAVEARFPGHLERVRRLVRQPSVSGTGEGMAEMVTLVEDELRALGATVETTSTGGWPLVYGHLDQGRPRTLLVYGMYDVQPVRGETWSVPPFSGDVVDLPEVGPSVVSRGVYNSKGPLAGVLSALHTIVALFGRLPVNVKFLVEGEEELASRSLPAYLAAHRGELACDGIYSPFYGENRRGTPVLKLGFKGVQFVELVCRGGAWGGPVKQGIHGGEAAWIANPAWRLVRTLGTLVDTLDRPAIPALNDGATEPTPADEALLATLATRFSPSVVLEQQQAKRFKYEDQLLRHYLFDAVVNLDGISSGHTGDGTKSMIPHEARASLSVRLVPGMRLDAVRAAITRHVEEAGGGAVEVRFLEGYPPARAEASAPMVGALRDAFAAVAGVDAEVWPIHGGSAPFSVLGDALGVPMIFGGLGHGGRQHAPDEYATLAGMKRLERSIIDFLFRYAALP
ncbi:MAG: M20/M25/M40 family metallo-hydrolase [Polyangia bacterium]